MPSKAFKLAEAMVSNPVMSDMVENPTATPTQIAAVETKTSAISDTGVISVNTKNIVSNNVLTQSFDSNQVVGFNLTDSINTVSPIVSVFKEVPVSGVSSKGQWDVNANATNYDFYDEKPISYSSSTLTPSATGDGTFTSSSPIVSDQWNLTTASYASKQKDLSALMSNGANDGTDIKFKPDGTKLYLLTSGTYDYVNQFSLSTAWDITTATLDGVTADLNSGTSITNPYSFCFTDDGTRIYVADFPGTIKEYTLSTAWDLSTVSFSDDLSVSGNEIQVSAINISSDGTKIYFSGQVSDKIWQVTMSTAKDLTTAGSPTQAINISSQEGDVESIQLKDDGTKLYMVGYGSDTIHQYSLSTAWDATTGSYDSVSYNLPAAYGGSNDRPRGFVFKPNGTNFYILGQTNDIVFQYSVGSLGAFNASDVGKKVVGNSGSAVITGTSGTYNSVTAFADTSAISSWQLFGVEGKADGSGIAFTQATASGGIPTSTLTDQSGPHTIHTGFFNQGFWWSNDGQYYYQLSQGTSTIVKVKCTTPWDLSTQTDEQTVGTTGTSHGITVSEDGLNIYYGGYDARIRRKPLSTAHDLSTAGSETSILCTDLNAAASYPWDFDISSDGTKLFFLSHIGGSHDGIGTLNLSTPYAIHTGVTLGTVLTNFDGGGNSQTFFSFNSDGSKLFVSDNTTSIYYWNLSSAYTLPSSATSDGSISFSGSNGVRSMVFNQYLFYTSFHDDRGGALGVEHEKQNRWTLSTSIDASSTIPAYSQYFPALTNSSTGQINSSSWLDINSMTADETKNDGDIFYAVSTDNRTSWGVANASDGVRKIARNNSGTWQYNNNAGSPSYYDFSNPTAGATSTFTSPDWHVLAFSTDGTKLISLDSGYLKLKSYNLSTAWDISTISSSANAESSISTGDLYGATISADGTKLIGYVNANGYVYEYTMSTPFDVTTLTADGNTNSLGGVSTSNAFNWFIKPGTYDTVYAVINRHLYKYTFTGGSIITGTVTRDANFLDLDPGNTKSYNNNGQLQFKPDGTEFYIGQATDSIIEKWTLSTAWDITTATKSSETVTSVNASSIWLKPNGEKLYYIDPSDSNKIKEINIGGLEYDTGETWVNGTTNNEHATLQQALGAQAFNRMNKAQLDAVADGYHFSQDSADTLDLMIAPYAASGSSPISDGVTINYDAAALVREAIPGTDYIAEFPNNTTINIKSLVNANMKVRAL